MEELKKKLIDIVNESALPAEAIWFVVKDFYRDIDDTYQEYKLMAEREAAAAQETKEETE